MLLLLQLSCGLCVGILCLVSLLGGFGSGHRDRGKMGHRGSTYPNMGPQGGGDTEIQINLSPPYNKDLILWLACPGNGAYDWLLFVVKQFIRPTRLPCWQRGSVTR